MNDNLQRQAPWWVRAYHRYWWVTSAFTIGWLAVWTLIGFRAMTDAHYPPALVQWVGFGWAPVAVGFFCWAEFVGRYHMAGSLDIDAKLRRMFAEVERELRSARGDTPPAEDQPTIN